MSNFDPSNPPITNSEVIPEIESQLFSDCPGSHLAAGIIAVGNTVMPGLDGVFEGYSLLRGNVYAKQKKYMPIDLLNEDGTETDPDDARSVHFAVVENALMSARVVGAMRLIIKSCEDSRALPIEAHYPEAFVNGPAPLYSTEISRLISRHEDAKVQRGSKWLLFTAGVSYVTGHELGPVYGAVEASLARGLRIEGVPATQLGAPKFVEEFNATKQPIRVDVHGLTQKIEGDQPNLLDAMRTHQGDFVYSGVVPTPAMETMEEVAVA